MKTRKGRITFVCQNKRFRVRVKQKTVREKQHSDPFVRSRCHGGSSWRPLRATCAHRWANRRGHDWKNGVRTRPKMDVEERRVGRVRCAAAVVVRWSRLRVNDQRPGGDTVALDILYTSCARPPSRERYTTSEISKTDATQSGCFHSSTKTGEQWTRTRTMIRCKTMSSATESDVRRRPRCATTCDPLLLRRRTTEYDRLRVR